MKLTIRNYEKLIGHEAAAHGWGVGRDFRIKVVQAYVRRDSDNLDYNFEVEKWMADGMEKYRVYLERNGAAMTVMNAVGTAASPTITVGLMDCGKPEHLLNLIFKLIQQVKLV